MHNNPDRPPTLHPPRSSDSTPLWRRRERRGTAGGSQKRWRQAAARRQIKRDSRDRCSWGVNPVGEWVIMFIHPAVAPSEATGFAGSLMRRRLRLLQEGRLTRLFLSLSQTANQVRGRRGVKERRAGRYWETHFHPVSSALSKAPFFSDSFSRWIFFFFFFSSLLTTKSRRRMGHVVAFCSVMIFVFLSHYHRCIHCQYFQCNTLFYCPSETSTKVDCDYWDMLNCVAKNDKISVFLFDSVHR